MEYDLLHIPKEVEKRTHKLKRLVPAPNSYFMKIKFQDNEKYTVVFSHAQGIIRDLNSNKEIAKSSGGKIKINNKCHFKIIDEARLSKKTKKRNH